MVIAGVVIDKKDEKKFVKLGITDSKKLSIKRRELLAPKIEELAKTMIVLRIPACKIDSYRSKGVNLDKIEAMKMAEIIDMCGADKVHIDSLESNSEKFKQIILGYLQNKKMDLVVENYSDETYPIVGAASIVAKVERDRAVEEIKRKEGFDFASLPYNEKILIEYKNGQRKLIEIGKLVHEKSEGVKIFGLDPQKLKIKKFPVTGYIEHRPMSILEVKLEYGNKVKLTPNHPLFVLTPFGYIFPVPISELRVGDYIAVAGKIPSSSSINSINLSHLIKNDIESEIEGYYRLGKIKLPTIFSLNENFLWLLGIYIAEGYLHDDYHIGISATDKRIRSKIKRISKQLKINPTEYPTSIVLNSKLLVEIIKGLNIGFNAYEKKFPDFIFSLKNKLLESILRGYFDGDGFKKQGKDAAETRSFILAEQLKWSLLILNKVSSYSKGKTKPRHTIYELSENTNSLSPDNIPNPFMLLKNLRNGFNITLRELSNLTGIKQEVLNRIEKNKVKRIQRKTLKKLVNGFRKRISPIHLKPLIQLLESDLCWVRIEGIRKFKKNEPVFDIEVRPKGNVIENFLGGFGGIILHNSGYSHDEKTIEFVEKLIKERKQLPPYVRKSWVTTQTLQEKSWQRRIKDFFKKKEKCKEGESEN